MMKREDPRPPMNLNVSKRTIDILYALYHAINCAILCLLLWMTLDTRIQTQAIIYPLGDTATQTFFLFFRRPNMVVAITSLALRVTYHFLSDFFVDLDTAVMAVVMELALGMCMVHVFLLTRRYIDYDKEVRFDNNLLRVCQQVFGLFSLTIPATGTVILNWRTRQCSDCSAFWTTTDILTHSLFILCYIEQVRYLDHQWTWTRLRLVGLAQFVVAAVASTALIKTAEMNLLPSNSEEYIGYFFFSSLCACIFSTAVPELYADLTSCLSGYVSDPPVHYDSLN